MDTSALEEIGLTQAQIKVYISLLELGETTSGPILKKTKLQNSVVYNSLNQLLELGLVTFILKGKRKYFSATDPNNLIKFIEDKKEKIEELLPKLIEKKTNNSNQQAQVFTGWKGVYNAFNIVLETLPEGSEYIGFPSGLGKQFNEESEKFIKDFQKKRDTRKYKVRFVTNESDREIVESYDYYPKFGKPEYRFVEGFAPEGVIIFGDSILTAVLDEEEPIVIIIKSKQISDSYRRTFENMWKIAKK